MENPFVLPTQEYGRDLNILERYYQDTARYLALETGRSHDECYQWVKETTHPSSGKLPLKDPKVLSLKRDKPGERDKWETTFLGYLQKVNNEDLIISPTLAAYRHPDQHESILAKYIRKNVDKRNAVKKKKFQSTMAGNDAEAGFYDILQSTFKIKNNSVSGGHASAFTPLYNKSTHSTLTSTCRSATGYANANNERFLYGNRHYYDVDVAIQNIISIINNSDYKTIAEAVEKYNLHIPSVEEVCETIKYSTDLYWRNLQWSGRIHSLISKLSDMERVAYTYTGNFYHLRELNPEFTRTFLDRFTTCSDTTIDNPEAVISEMDGDLEAYVGILHAHDLKNKPIFKIKESEPETYARIASSVNNIFDLLKEYTVLFKAFWVTLNPPASVAVLPDAIRRGVLVSDTDSTIFTVQDWTMWYKNGVVDFDAKTTSVWAFVVYIAQMTTMHLLALLSSNMGVAKPDLYKLSMKNEYMMPALSLTSRAKHYAYYISAQEGNVYKKMKTDIKGVELKSTKAPKEIIEKLHKYIMKPMDWTLEGKKISIKEMMQEVADQEHAIIDSLNQGKIDYLTTAGIKAAESYANPQGSNYIYYDFWNTVFGPKYGEVPPPPYSTVKVSLNATSKTKVAEWIRSIKDVELAERLEDWMGKNNKLAGITQFLIPMDVISTKGMPEEIIQCMDIRKIVFTTMAPFYLVLETYGVYMKDKNITKLVSDIM